MTALTAKHKEQAAEQPREAPAGVRGLVPDEEMPHGGPMVTSKRLFDVQAAAEYLRSIGATSATVTFVRTLITSGRIPHLKLGKKFYLSRTALDAWLVSHERRMK
jgi:excisionase family DNA binding protein